MFTINVSQSIAVHVLCLINTFDHVLFFVFYLACSVVLLLFSPNRNQMHVLIEQELHLRWPPEKEEEKGISKSH